jgi:hypothetical protein
MDIAKARRLGKNAVELGSTTAAERCNVDLPVGTPLCTANNRNGDFELPIQK